MINHSLNELSAFLESVHSGLDVTLLDIGARTPCSESDASHPIGALLLLIISTRNTESAQGNYIPAR